MNIAVDSPARDDVRALLDEHLTEMRATSPEESVHALAPAALTAPTITFLTARSDETGALLGCGALSELAPGPGGHGEIKSMRTARSARGLGVATRLLGELLALAAERGYERVSLETGSEQFFAPARRIYTRHGFVECEPFADYVPDPNSVFMTFALPVPPPEGDR
ncbi:MULTISPECIES: GNAT family N-acetyltransferase [Isoptericola]|uniref:GNAT family N-acetyltransferase n=1 Tax=Isoptericola haloaureus TaxID=1542902 RepID=A0ABU7Z2G3_9MICO|nr:GNAT family N-acetyltransferase [Isoptericola sp. AK164]